MDREPTEVTTQEDSAHCGVCRRHSLRGPFYGFIAWLLAAGFALEVSTLDADDSLCRLWGCSHSLTALFIFLSFCGVMLWFNHRLRMLSVPQVCSISQSGEVK